MALEEFLGRLHMWVAGVDLESYESGDHHVVVLALDQKRTDKILMVV